jgi:hypothetical protein
MDARMQRVENGVNSILNLLHTQIRENNNNQQQQAAAAAAAVLLPEQQQQAHQEQEESSQGKFPIAVFFSYYKTLTKINFYFYFIYFYR